MPALLTKMSSVPKISAVLVTAARSSSAEALSAFIASALPPPDSTSCTSFRAFSSELEKVNATDAPSEASRRTMPAPMPFEPPVTRATLPVNDFSCTAAMNILQSSPTPILDDSVQKDSETIFMNVGAKIMLTGKRRLPAGPWAPTRHARMPDGWSATLTLGLLQVSAYWQALLRLMFPRISSRRGLALS